MGWTCPRCQRCYAPSVMMCVWCVPQSVNASGTTVMPYTVIW